MCADKSGKDEPVTTRLKPRAERAAGSFYGRRKAKTLKPAQDRLMTSLLPELLLDITKPAPENLGQLFSHLPDKIFLEIGFGAGEHLLDHASRRENCGFIGCEPFINGMAKAVYEIDNQAIGNIRLYDEDAVRLLNWLPDESLDGIDLFYPDPWPKKRHWKRRFVNGDNLARFYRVLKPGANFRFASDIDHYVNWTLFHILFDKKSNARFSWQAISASDWQKPWPNWHSTRYEQKAMREGRKPAYLNFTRL